MRIRTLDRRALLTAAGASLLLPRAAVARHALAQDGQADPAMDRRIEVRRNLFTRAATDVRVNGQGPFRFVIDTGAEATSVSDRLAAALALPPRAPILVHGVTEAAVTPSCFVDRLSLGWLDVAALRCPVLPHASMGADGLLGLDVLGRLKITYNATHRSIQLDPGGRRVLAEGEAGRITRTRPRGLRVMRARFGQLIMTQVVVGGVQAMAFVDSGAQYSFGNRLLLDQMRRPSEHRDSWKTVQVIGATSHRLEAEVAWAGDVRLGNAIMGPAPLHFADLYCFEALGLAGRPALLIGSDLLSRFRMVILDFQEGVVSLSGLRRLDPLEIARMGATA